MSTATPQPKENMGAPLPRIDGRAKVTGAARYAADFAVGNAAQAYLLTSTIARGRITGFDLTKAQAIPGVLHIMTHENAGPIGSLTFMMMGGQSSDSVKPLDGPAIHYAGQIIGMVVAESYETARQAARAVGVTYAAEAPTSGFDPPGGEVIAAATMPEHEDPKAGDAEAAFAKAAVKIDAEYSTPPQHHNTIELFSTTCVWNGDELTVYEPSQWVKGLQVGLATQLGIKPDKVRVISPYVGGAFGSKGTVTNRTVLVALAARLLRRPVRLVATRAQGFSFATYRAETKQRVRLAADASGKLVAFTHDGYEITSRTDAYAVAGTKNTAVMYDYGTVLTKVSIVRADRNTPGFMRSPGEVPYMFALESAMDELAVALKIDPVELRRRNDTRKSPINGAPYTSRSLVECYDQAAAAFGWAKRNPQPRSMQDGEWLIGYGCATACYPTQHNPASIRIKLTGEGQARVEIGVHDVGTGAYTAVAQIVSEKLGLPIENVEVVLGESTLPPGPIAGGSVTTASVAAVADIACAALRKRLFGEGALAASATPTVEAYAGAFERIGTGAIEEYAEWSQKGARPGAMAGLHKGQVGISGGQTDDAVMFSFGAEFVEVRVHSLTGEIRVPRVVGAFAAGRIVNTRTANSQLMGGMIWGIGSALHEFTEVDEREARYVNDNIAEYLVPVNADVPVVDIILVPEVDTIIPMGIKGLGELGNVGTSAAIANAVYHATGKRYRDLPLVIDKTVA